MNRHRIFKILSVVFGLWLGLILSVGIVITISDAMDLRELKKENLKLEIELKKKELEK